MVKVRAQINYSFKSSGQQSYNNQLFPKFADLQRFFE